MDRHCLLCIIPLRLDSTIRKYFLSYVSPYYHKHPLWKDCVYSGENTIDLDLDEVIKFVCQELQGYGQRQGYPWLHQAIQMRFLVQDTMSVSIIVEYKWKVEFDKILNCSIMESKWRLSNCAQCYLSYSLRTDFWCHFVAKSLCKFILNEVKEMAAWKTRVLITM